MDLEVEGVWMFKITDRGAQAGSMGLDRCQEGERWLEQGTIAADRLGQAEKLLAGELLGASASRCFPFHWGLMKSPVQPQAEMVARRSFRHGARAWRSG